MDMDLAFDSYLVIVLEFSNSKLSMAHNRTFYNRIMVFISRGIPTWWLWVGALDIVTPRRHRRRPPKPAAR